MDAAMVIFAVLAALFAIWGAMMLWRGVFEWLFAPKQVRGAVVVSCVKDVEDLDFLLTEAEKNCMCHKESRLVVILTPNMVKVWADMEKEALLCGDVSPGMVLYDHGAEIFVGDFLEL